MDRNVHALIPMAHVSNIEKSIEFYALMGFRIRSRFEHAGRLVWAWLESGTAHLMLTAASGPIDPTQQAILLYLYSNDIKGLRTSLLAAGLKDGGKFGEGPLPGDHRIVFETTYPHYMPEGEIRVGDPDGYCLLIGQAG